MSIFRGTVCLKLIYIMKEERCLWSEDVIVGLGEAENQPGKLRSRWRRGEELEVQKESTLKRSLFKRHQSHQYWKSQEPKETENQH